MTDGRIERGRATREQLVETARELFGTHGYEATSIGAILEASGAARGALYHHFATKEALFDAVLDREMATLATVVRDAALAQADPADALAVGCLTWLRAAAEPTIQRIVLVDAPAVVGWPRWRELDEQYTLGGTKAALRSLARDGRVDEGESDLLAHMILAAVGEAALSIARADDTPAALANGERAVQTLLERLLTAPVASA
jgi:AcrR family transcriptional regulator